MTNQNEINCYNYNSNSSVNVMKFLGKVIERGTHAELVALQGRYWRMCRGQHAA